MSRQSYMFEYTRPDGSQGCLWRKSAQNLAAQRRWFKKWAPAFTLNSVVLDWICPLLEELRKPENAEAAERLRAKARWEHMTPSAVIREWGDPRKWK